MYFYYIGHNHLYGFFDPQVMCILSVMFYMALLFAIICGALVKAHPAHQTSFTTHTQRYFATSHQPTPPANTLQCAPSPEPDHPPTSPSQYVSPSAPYYPPANGVSHVSPSTPVQPPTNASSYTSAEPPPYELAVTLYKSQHVPSDDPPDESTTEIAP